MKKLIPIVFWVLMGMFCGYVVQSLITLHVYKTKMQEDVRSLSDTQMVREERPEPASRGGPGREQGHRTMTMKATAYNLTKNLTAAGTRVCPGTIAVDPEVIPLGTGLMCGSLRGGG